ncbi:MAG: glycosyltransferase family 4 protein [bacterium]
MSERLKVLIIPYYFPPLGGGGVLRPLNFAKYLPDFGVDVGVLTIKNIHYHCNDYSLLQEVSEKVKIRRVETIEPLRLVRVIKEFKANIMRKKYFPPQEVSYGRGWLLWFIRSFIIPDDKLISVPFLVMGALRMISENGYKIVMTTSPPDSMHIVGLILKFIFGVRWIADFRDPWHTSNLKKSINRLSYSIDGSLERLVIKNADIIITTAPSLKSEFLKRFPFLRADKVVTITNGFDENEIEYIQKKKRDDEIVFLHCGNFSDIRTAMPFLRAVSRIYKTDRDFARCVRFRFIGAFKREEREWVETSGLSEIIDISGYKSHRETLNEMLNADVLLIILNEEFEQTRISAKVFEYLWAGKPILAILPKGDTQTLIEEHNAGICVNTYSEDGIINGIYQIISKLEDEFILDKVKIRKYSRKVLTKKLVEIMRKMLK